MNQSTALNAREPFKPQWMARIPSPSMGYRVFITRDVKRYIDNIWPMRRFKLEKALEQLRAIPRPFNALHKKNQVGNLSLNIDSAGFIIQYLINSGEVTVVAIRADLKDERNEKMGLYEIRVDGGKIEQKRTKSSTIKTSYAAVNGQSNTLDRATRLMIVHLQYAFRQDGLVEHFTLFHNPSQGGMDDTFESAIDRKGGPTKVAAHLSQILRNTHETGQEVKWVAHSQGGLIIKSAVEHHNQAYGTPLDSQSIQFNGGANNIAQTEMIMQKAGIKVLGYNNNPNDIVPMVVGKNTRNPVRIAACVVALPLVLWGPSHLSPHTLPYTGTGLWRDWKFWNFKRAKI